MPNTVQPCSKVADYITILEDTNLHSKAELKRSFDGLKAIFDEGCDLSPAEVNAAFDVLTAHIKDNLQLLPLALSAISSLLNNVKAVEECIPFPNLLSSALSLLHVHKEICGVYGTENLKELCFEVLFAYPRNDIGAIIKDHCSVVIEIITLTKSSLTNKLRMSKEVCNFLIKLLSVLSEEEKIVLVREGLKIWFNDLFPTLAKTMVSLDIDMKLYLECLETVTESLVHIDYSNFKQWQSDILPCVYNVQKYPSIMKSQLENGSAIWHRFWIVLVKLLKCQITRHFGPYGTPINALLPIVETAFKMDVTNRCRAFQCWQVLIDNFFNEKNDTCQPKRINLLLIPLKLNNAKVEATALSKFHTWWHLIRRYQPKQATCPEDSIILLFMAFVFGKQSDGKKPAVIGAGVLYDSVKSFGLEAFAKIVGHSDCKCPSNLPDLNGKMINNKLLASNLSKWMHALEKAICFTHTLSKNDDSSSESSMPVVCVWKAFLQAIVDMPPNGVRRDMFNCLIEVPYSLSMMESQDYPSDVLFNLMLTLCEDNANVARILINADGEDMPLKKVMLTILNPQMWPVLQRYKTEKLSSMLKPLTDLIVESLSVEWLLQKLTPNDSTMKIWTALVLSVKESKTLIPPMALTELLMWPVRSLDRINDDKYAALTWYRMANLDVKRLCRIGLDKEIVKKLTEQEKNNSNRYFRLCLTICLLKYKLVSQQDSLSFADVLPSMFQNLTSEISDYEELGQAVPLIVDTIVMMLSNLLLAKRDKAEVAFNCVKIIMRIIFLEVKTRGINADSPINDEILIMLNSLFNALELVFKSSLYGDSNVSFIDELKEQIVDLDKESTLFKLICTKIKTLSLSLTKSVRVSIIDSVYNSINSPVNIISENNMNGNETNKEFTSPNVKKVVKKAKKKEASIVNTVVENGEEYVVVKSNWKFNPKRLTENQKEKLKRKREDIPALYQDLSQSQDEFKLSCWKTDSQDATSNSTNSKSESSTADDKSSNILRNMTSSDVVPQIMENMLSESLRNKCDSPISNCTKETTNDFPANKYKKTERLSLSTPKTPKSPRMALKDRVLLNVRNLTEKSASKNDGNGTNVDELQAENVQKTPTTKQIDSASLVHSAPPLISTDRPSRMKRIPKKFDDVKLFGLKKKNAQSYTCLQDKEKNDMDECDKESAVNTESTIIPVEKTNVSVNEEITEPSVLIETTDDVAVVQEDIEKTEVTLVMDQELVKGEAEKPSPEEKKYTQVINDSQDIPLSKVDQDVPTNNDIQDCKNYSNIEVLSNKKSIELSNANESNLITVNTNILTEKIAPSKPTPKKVREIKILAIDTVEGNPFLQSPPTSRLRRKVMDKDNLNNSKGVTEKSKTKRDSKASLKSDKKLIKNKDNVTDKPDKSRAKADISPNVKSKSKEIDTSSTVNEKSPSINVEETQESCMPNNDRFEDVPCSEDIIESSQDSTITTISTKSTKATPKRLPIIAIERLTRPDDSATQDLLQDSNLTCDRNKSGDGDGKDDIELSQNKTAEVSVNHSVLTENMDTEPATEETMSEDVIIVNDEACITIDSDRIVGPETQELAEADTQPNDPEVLMEIESEEIAENCEIVAEKEISADDEIPVTADIETNEEVIEINSESSQPIAACSDINADVCSPFKEDTQRKQDFLNDTSEISPIKVQSPDVEKDSPSREETSGDYLVVKLTSPVQSNGEPFDKGSPEFFTEDKVSPDKRDQSPPRAEVPNCNGSSPSSSLSLKKNRPQAMRATGRAAHMLGLCVPESLNTIKNCEKPEEPKKGNASTPARRNLRVLYNAVADGDDNLDENGEQNFLKFKKDLPSTNSSPAVPILKRKLIDIVDDVTVSPANKRKRVSFHDPPISCTVSVQKYIEPGCKSPSSSKLDRQMTRSITKSPKRLDNAFVKLETTLCKTVESFKEQTDSLNDTNVSLDVTPTVEVVVTSELNDTEPICLDLITCTDSIESIALELSSPAMQELFVKEMQGKVDTVGDLAKMTEIEVNRLSIKAPKIQVAKKVLTDYAIKRALQAKTSDVMIVSRLDDTVLATEMNVDMTESTPLEEVATVSVCDVKMQTVNETQVAITQTVAVPTTDSYVQTMESGYKSTTDVISSCLSDREDFIDKLSERLDETSIAKMCENLPTKTITEIFNKKTEDMTSILQFLRQRFDKRDLILLCCELLKTVHEET